jgi:hypothetical protein
VLLVVMWLPPWSNTGSKCSDPVPAAAHRTALHVLLKRNVSPDAVFDPLHAVRKQSYPCPLLMACRCCCYMCTLCTSGPTKVHQRVPQLHEFARGQGTHECINM